ncbi:hypothetical protein [Halobacterium sp. CBA1126]|nr:hypothetical protein [Halobacterium sp. CBA1126]
MVDEIETALEVLIGELVDGLFHPVEIPLEFDFPGFDYCTAG